MNFAKLHGNIMKVSLPHYRYRLNYLNIIKVKGRGDYPPPQVVAGPKRPGLSRRLTDNCVIPVACLVPAKFSIKGGSINPKL